MMLIELLKVMETWVLRVFKWQSWGGLLWFLWVDDDVVLLCWGKVMVLDQGRGLYLEQARVSGD